MTTEQRELLGVIVSFSPPSEVEFYRLRAALSGAGWESGLAREMLPRDAFARAARQLRQGRLIDVVAETDDSILFQLTRKWSDENEVHFALDTQLTLDKTTGRVTCSDDALRVHAEGLISAHLGKRSRQDVLRILKKVYEGAKADLVVISDAGGVYFVPDYHGQLIDATRKFLAHIDGKLRSEFRVFWGDPEAEQSAAGNVLEHLQGLIAEFRDSCAVLTHESKPFLVDRRTAEVTALRDKLDSYRGLLSAYSDEITSEIDKAERDMLARISAPSWAPDAEPVTPAPVADPDLVKLAELRQLMAG